jgi:hypothetical protein
MQECCICERPNVSERDEYRHVLMETSPKVLQRHLLRQGYEFHSYYFLCRRCENVSNAKLKLLLKNKKGLIKRDYHFSSGYEVMTKSYWFTIEISIHGYICIYDKISRRLISEKMLNNKILIEKVYKKVLHSVLDELLSKIK